MGTAQWDYNAVIMKNTSAILVLSEEDAKKPEKMMARPVSTAASAWRYVPCI